MIFLALSCGLIWTTDYVHSQANASRPVDPADDTFGENPLDADGDGNVEVIPPTDDRSSLPNAPDTPEPAANPADDGVPDDGQTSD